MYYADFIEDLKNEDPISQKIHRTGRKDPEEIRPALFVCSNGILDLDEGIFYKEKFIENPKVYKTSSRIEYKEFAANDPLLVQFQQFLHKIYPQAVEFWAPLLRGGKGERKLYIHMGDSAGITTLLGLVERVLGGYCLKTRRDVFIKKEGERFVTSTRGEIYPFLEQDIRMVFSGDITGAITHNPFANNPYYDDNKNIIRSVHLVNADISRVEEECEIIRYSSKFYRKGSNKIPVTKEEQDQQHIYEAINYDDRLDEFASVFLYLLFEKYKN